MTTLSAAGIARAAYGAGFRGEALVTAIAVALGESTGRVEVVNSLGCVGLWQINQPVHVGAHPQWTRAWLQNAANNAAAAFVLSSGGRVWGPWTVYTSGKYKDFLAVSRPAAAAAASNSGLSGGGPATQQGPRGGGRTPMAELAFKDRDNPDEPPEVPESEDEPDPRVRLGRLFVHGSKLEDDVSDAVVEAVLSWSTSEVTQLALTFVDPQFLAWRGAKFAKGTQLLYREPGMADLELRVSAFTVDGGPTGTGGFTINARSAGVHKLKQRTGPRVMRKVSPTDFVKAECRAAGLAVVAQPSAQRAQVARDVASKGEESAKGSAKASSWTTFMRLASELGYYVFEYLGTVYFGKPSWLIDQDTVPVQVAMPLPNAPEVWASRTMPSVAVSDDSDTPVMVSGVVLEKSRLAECRPGGALRLRGLPPFNEKYLITSMSMPLLGTGGIELSASTPVDPAPQPPPKPPKKGRVGDYDDGKGGSSGSGGVTQSGSKSSLDFVRVAMSASNAVYVFGAEASVSDATPAALDCSELVQWALGRIGVPFVDGSASQIAACRGISVAQAIATRGALLYKPGHIGISCGNGQSVEARNPSDGVGVFRAADIAWTQGGLVPGVQYG